MIEETLTRVLGPEDRALLAAADEEEKNREDEPYRGGWRCIVLMAEAHGVMNTIYGPYG